MKKSSILNKQAEYEMGLIPTYEIFIKTHQNQLITSGVPEYFWPTIYEKISNETFDAGTYFDLLQIDYGEEIRGDHDPVWQVQSKAIMDHKDANNIFLIDHAWTYRVEQAKKQLRELDSLRQRMCFIMGINTAGQDDVEQLIEKIFDESWRYSNTYSIGNAVNVEDRIPVWYIMDELGSGIQHNDRPNVRLVPFIHVQQQVTYSLLFPIRQLEAEEMINRDFVEGNTDETIRCALLFPWKYARFDDYDHQHVDVDVSYFLCGHVDESLAETTNVTLPRKENYKVYTECEYVASNLTDEAYTITENRDEADILWLNEHFKDYKDLSSQSKYINQFPYEYVITVKDLLPITCRRNVAEPHWLPITYNLKNELVRFVSYYQYREDNGMDNHWIIKPFNLARGLDTHLTNNLNYIVRLPCTGPKIAQKYIEKPLLFHRDDCGLVKFDVRYVILLKSCKPLRLYVYKKFFLRFANVSYELKDLHNYERHYTVMNYRETKLKAMLYDEFVVEFNRQYHDHDWYITVEPKIMQMIREIFLCAIKEEPPLGIAHNPQSRALYAMDLMLEKNEKCEIVPKVLEINWMPDCKRACEYYPNFYNDIFNLLFRDQFDSNVFNEI